MNIYVYMCVCAVSKGEKSSVDDDIQRAFCLQRDHLERTVNSLKMRLAKSAEEHEKVYVKIMKVNNNTDCKSREHFHCTDDASGQSLRIKVLGFFFFKNRKNSHT